ncbi:MAG: cysteine hydrolase family protein [Candidatus Aminicenantales bacterium]
MKKFILGLLAVLLTLAALPASAARDNPEEKRMRPALLVIDIQNAFLPQMAEADKGTALYMINAAIELFRAHGFSVIRVYHSDLKYGPAPGRLEFEFPASALIKPDDPMIVKNYPNGFKKTSLDKLLREKGVNTVFLCGLSAVGCVLATYHGALDLDYEAFMVKSSLLSHDAALTRSVQEICETVGYEALRVMLENAKK